MRIDTSLREAEAEAEAEGDNEKEEEQEEEEEQPVAAAAGGTGYARVVEMVRGWVCAMLARAFKPQPNPPHSPPVLFSFDTPT